MSLEEPVGELSADGASLQRPAVTGRVRWYCGRPLEYFDRFSRIVWWCGQVQLFIAVGAVPTGLLLIGVAIMTGFPLSQGALFVGATALGLAGPIALSGFMLRHASAQIAPFGPLKRWLELLAWVVLIAVIATIAALISLYLTVGAVLIVWSMISASA